MIVIINYYFQSILIVTLLLLCCYYYSLLLLLSLLCFIIVIRYFYYYCQIVIVEKTIAFSYASNKDVNACDRFSEKVQTGGLWGVICILFLVIIILSVVPGIN